MAGDKRWKNLRKEIIDHVAWGPPGVGKLRPKRRMLTFEEERIMPKFEIVTADTKGEPAPVQMYLERQFSGGVAVIAKRGGTMSTLITFDTDGYIQREQFVSTNLGFKLSSNGVVAIK